MKTKIDIRRAIKERGYTIREFALKCGMTPANLSQIINGNPTIKKLCGLCEVLECDVTELFYPIDENNTEYCNDGSFSASTITKQEEKQVTLQPTLKTTTFCPHCGAKVEVGVVLIAHQ